MSHMPERHWLETWKTWMAALHAHGAVIQAFEIGPPAPEADVIAAEARTGRPIPASLREVLLTFSGRVRIKWYLDDGPSEPKALNRLSKFGELEWNVATLTRYRSDTDDAADDIFMYGEPMAALLREAIAFQEVPNGDAFMVDCRTGAVVYFDHEGGDDNGVVLERSFADFVTSYSMIGCSGSDWFMLAPIHANGRIDPEAPIAHQWRAWLEIPASPSAT
jgi:hypothetical protein